MFFDHNFLKTFLSENTTNQFFSRFWKVWLYFCLIYSIFLRFMVKNVKFLVKCVIVNYYGKYAKVCVKNWNFAKISTKTHSNNFLWWYRLIIVLRSFSQIFSFRKGFFSKLQAIEVSVFDFHWKHAIFYSWMVYFEENSKTGTSIPCYLEKRAS